jgi:serine acetyltransferase
MGSMVFRNVENGATVVGNPARVTKGNNEHKVFV